MSEIVPQNATTVATQTPRSIDETDETATVEGRSAERGVAVALLALLAVSWRLWWPQSTYPMVPLVSWFNEDSWLGSLWLSRGLSLGTAGLLLRLALTKQSSRRSWWVVTGFLSMLFVLDQHRLQPWAYQACLYGLLFASLDSHHVRRWMRWLTASIYIYSASGKFDVQFLHTVGQQFVTLIMGPSEAAPTTPRLLVAATLPAIELAVGLGLLFKNTSRCAGVGAMLMHMGLIIAIGPWLLGHSGGVLVWNAALLVQAWFLFVRTADAPALRDSNSGNSPLLTSRWGKPWATALLTLALLLPLLLPLTERFGLWDHWLSWSLYSPHTSRVNLEVHDWAAQQLPSYMQPYLSSEASEDGWRKISLERWSLQELGVPVYPQSRYQLQLAILVADHLKDSQAIRCEVKSLSNRLTGERETTRCQGKQAMQQALKKISWLL